MTSFLTPRTLATFSVLVTQPAVAFRNGNPVLPTIEGEFLMKNLVLLAARRGYMSVQSRWTETRHR